ncbi:histidine kinase [Mastigocladus laminosus UU774]|nr:histidine kinase [Mastigocladus laminosus UU774]
MGDKGVWGVWGDEGREQGAGRITDAQCPIPNAQCPMT